MSPVWTCEKHKSSQPLQAAMAYVLALSDLEDNNDVDIDDLWSYTVDNTNQGSTYNQV